MKQNQTHSWLVKLTASASAPRYKAVNRTEGLTPGFAERWRIQPRWRSFDRQPLSSMPHCHHTGRQSERLPWSTVSLQIYHFKSPLSPLACLTPFCPHQHITLTLEFLYVITSEGPCTHSKPAVMLNTKKNKKKNRITHRQILFRSNWQNRSKVTQTSCHIAADESDFFQQLHF